MKKVLPIFICILTSLTTQASTPPESRLTGFIENRGQVVNQNNIDNTDVRFILSAASGVNIQIRNSGISFDTYQSILNTSKISFHRLDMNIVGMSSDVEIIPKEVLPGVTNYAAPHSRVSGLKSYSEILYKNVYDGVDFRVKTADKGLLKYDFVVSDAANFKKIKLEYAGFDTFKIADGKLIFTLSGKTITEEIPASWMTTSGRSIAVEYRVLKKSTGRVIIGFSTQADISKSEGELIIDPLAVREWATYYGDSLYDKPAGIATDSLGNIFIVGTTSSTARMASSGSYQNTFSGGNTDVFVTRFNQHGLRQWATYYGGSGDDRGLDIDVDSYERIFITGTTTSQDSIGSSEANQTENGGGKDGFIAEFDRHGNFIWDSYIGGSGNETATACHSDNLGNVVVVGYSDTGGFLENDSITPVRPYSAGIDAFLVKYNSEGVMVWSSYFGGPGTDYASDVVVDSLKNWAMVGSTNSEISILTGMAMQPDFGGETDGFIVKIDTTGSIVWASYFGGAGRDSIAGITSVNGKYFISGTTDSTLAYSDSSSYQMDYGGGGDAFAACVGGEGMLNWFTYLGGAVLNGATDISRDYGGDIYISGITLTDSVFEVDTAGIFQIDTGTDYFVSKFNAFGEHLYTGTFGGEKNDRCTAIAVYGYTSIYVTGTTFSLTHMVEYGPEEMPYQTNKDSTSIEGFIARLTQYTSTPPLSCGGGNFGGGGGGGSDQDGNGNPGPPPIGICFGDSMQLHLNGGALGQGAQWVWYENECGGIDNYIGEGETIWVKPDSTTTYFVRAESVEDETNCSSVTVHVDYQNTAIASAQDSICPGTTLNLFGDGGYYYNWTGPANYTNSAQNPMIDSVQYNQAGTYTLIATTQFGCKDTTDVDVFLLTPPDFNTASTAVTCNGGSDGSISVTPGDTATIVVSWPILDTNTTSLSNLNAGNYLLLVTNYNGCVTTQSIPVTQPAPLIDSLVTLGAYCDHANGKAQVYTSSSNTPFEVNWAPGGQTGMIVSNLLPDSNAVIMTDALGCTDSATFIIANLGFFTASIVPDSIFLELFETTAIEVVTSPTPDNPSYVWTPPEGLSCWNCPNPTLNPDSTTWYTVVVTSKHDCISSDSIFVERALPEPTTFLPDAFSPNGDGINDELCLLGVRIISFELHIFDRSGEEVFYSSHLDKCWDGTIDGAPAVGTFIYTLQAQLQEGMTVNDMGEITIQR